MLLDVTATPLFACSSTACAGWADGKTHAPTKELFRALQVAINQALKLLGKSQVSTDGLIGAGTVKAYQTVRSALPSLATLNFTTKEALAAHAYIAKATIENSLGYLSRTAPTPPPAPPNPVTGGNQTEPIATPIIPKPGAWGTSKIFLAKNKYYVLGGVAVIALGATFLLGDKDGKKSKGRR